MEMERRKRFRSSVVRVVGTFERAPILHVLSPQTVLAALPCDSDISNSPAAPPCAFLAIVVASGRGRVCICTTCIPVIR